MFRGGERRDIRGIPTSVFGDTDVALVLSRLDQALGLIETHDARRFRRLRFDVERILVFGHETTRLSYFDPRIDWIVVTARYAAAEDTCVDHLAASLVHEATHARIARAGIQYQEGARARIEGACANQELEFAQKLPAAAELVVRSQAAVARAAAGEARWSNKRFQEDHLRAARENGLPELLVRLLAWVDRRRAA